MAQRGLHSVVGRKRQGELAGDESIAIESAAAPGAEGHTRYRRNREKFAPGEPAFSLRG